MQIHENVQMAVATLMAHKLRSGLTILGILIGNASVIAIVGIGQGAQQLAASQLQSLGANILFVDPGFKTTQRDRATVPKTLVYADAEAIASQVPVVKQVAPQISDRAILTHRHRNTQTEVVGTTPEYLAVRNFQLEKGRFLNDFDLKRNHRIIILGSEVAQKLFPQQNPLGQRLRVKNISFQVVGVLAEKGSYLGSSQDDRAFIPLTTMTHEIVGRTSPYGIELTFISVTAQNTEKIQAAQFQIENLLRLRHHITGEDDFTVEVPNEMIAIVRTVSLGLTLMLSALAGISLVVGGIGVMNMMLVSVTERTPEIGLRKALGARHQDILTQFLIESVILCATGGLLGTLVGIGVICIIGLVTPLPIIISPLVIIASIAVSGLIGVLFGVLPAQQAAKLNPTVALRRV